MGTTASQPNTYAVSTQNADKGENETHIFRHPSMADRDLLTTRKEGSLKDVFVERFKNKQAPYLGQRIYDESSQRLEPFFTWKTNEEVELAAASFGSGLLGLSLVPSTLDLHKHKGRALGFYGKNSLDFFIADIACVLFDIVVINLYDTLGPDSIVFILSQTQTSTCLVAASQLQTLLSLKAEGKLPSLEHVIVAGQQPGDVSRAEAEKLLHLHTVEEVMCVGAESPKRFANTTAESIYAFSYTSGTSGEPKGAMITHGNILCMVPCLQEALTQYLQPGKRYLSYLPMAHILERVVFHVSAACGMLVGVFSGDVNKLTDDVMALKPTLFLSVPRVYVKIRHGILKSVSQQSWLKEALFNHALAVKVQNLAKGKRTHSIYDKIIFSKIRERLGGAVELMISGSAPLEADVVDFLRAAFSIPVIEGYGQTEGCGIEFLLHPEDFVSRGVGGPQPYVEFKLVDVPELGYLTADRNKEGELAPRGEVWVRGPSVVAGYYGDEKRWAEGFTPDGWLKSGDIAVLAPPLNNIVLIDRKKDIFKLSQGEYIAPDKLESVYRTACSYLSDIFIYGDSHRDRVVAIAFIEESDLATFAKEKGVDASAGVDALRQSITFKVKLLDDLRTRGKAFKLNSLEMIKAVYITRRSFADEGLKTATMKLKRHAAKKRFEEEIERLYSE